VCACVCVDVEVEEEEGGGAGARPLPREGPPVANSGSGVDVIHHIR